MSIDVVLRQIEEAFSNLCLDDGTSLLEAEALDDDADDTALARAADERRDWRLMSAERLASCSAALCFVDAKGMRFHLPAFMGFALRSHKSSTSFSIDALLYRLAESSDERFVLLDLRRRLAVREFFVVDGRQRR